jgi:hypothetical protein
MGFGRIRDLIKELRVNYSCCLNFTNFLDPSCSELINLVTELFGILVGGEIEQALVYFFSFSNKGKMIWERIKNQIQSLYLLLC